MPILRVPIARTRASITLDDSLWEELDRIAEASKETHPPNGLSRNDVLEDLLLWAVRAHQALMRDRIQEFILETLARYGEPGMEPESERPEKPEKPEKSGPEKKKR